MRSRLTSCTIEEDEQLHLLVKGRSSFSEDSSAGAWRSSFIYRSRRGSSHDGSKLTFRARSLKMKLLDKLRTKPSSRNKDIQATAVVYAPDRSGHTGPDLAASLPERVLGLIFSYVCPHAQDLSYQSWEDTAGFGKGCKLCQTRDLARCIRVCKSWHSVAQKLLYQSIRIDITHFCGDISESDSRIKRSSFRRSPTQQEDPVQQRLVVFTRTAHENQDLAHLTKCLKVPWMIRETARADLARAVSVLPNLQYVDLPAGEYDKPALDVVLNQELLRKCPDLRTMRYNKGAEESFQLLVLEKPWSNLENLDLCNIKVDPEVFLRILATFPHLRELRLLNIDSLEDGLFSTTRALPSFPALSKLVLEGRTKISIGGLCTYFSNPFESAFLSSLSLIDTNLPADQLHKILAVATGLKELRYHNEVSASMSTLSTPLLSSSTLETLHFEILPPPSNDVSKTDSYYTYFSKSLLSGSLSNLRTVFAYNDHLPDLLLPAPLASSSPRLSTYSSLSLPSSQSTETNLTTDSFLGHASSLKLYTKPTSAPEQEWSLTVIEPPDASKGRSGSISTTRPLSMLSNIDDSASTGSSVNLLQPGVKSGGGFLAVPSAFDYGGKVREIQQVKQLSWRKSLNFQPAKVGSEWMGA